MKYMIISDIHGSDLAAAAVLEQFRQQKADYLIVLGDVLYHGPRNPLPEGYNPQRTAMLLNRLREKIIAVRGNCDAEVDQMMLEFPCMSGYALVFDEGSRLFLTHGHIYNEKNMPPLVPGDMFVSGHTHVHRLEKTEGITFCNPGSVSLPKENQRASYAVFERGAFSLFTLDGAMFKTLPAD